MSKINVLHFLPYIDNDNMATKFVDEILQGGESSCVFSILTFSKTDVAAQWHGIRLFRIKSPCLTFKSYRQFLKILAESKADIVHIHGLWNFCSSTIYRWSHKQGRAVVLSTYKSTMPWNMPTIPISPRFLRFHFSKRKMISGASTIHAITRQEMKNIRAINSYPFSHKPINGRLETVGFSINDANGVADYHKVLLEMERLYRKVVDSNPFRLMTEEDHKIEDNLIALGAALQNAKGESDIFLQKEVMQEHLKRLDVEHWRRIQIHASDQNVLTYVLTAYQFLGGKFRAIDVDKIDRYCIPKETSSLDMSQPRIHRARMHQIVEDYERNETEQRLCIMFLNIKHLLDKGKLSRRNLVDLYLFLRYETYDEYVFDNMLDDLDIKGFAGRILCVLQQSLSLEAGYTPIEIIDDGKTKHINEELYKSEIQ